MSFVSHTLPAQARPLHRSGAVFALAVLLLLMLLGLLHSVIAPYAPGAAGTGPALAPPSPYHPFGTDILGRDVWSDTLHGLAGTLTAAWAGLTFALLAGELAGLAAAHLLPRIGPVLRLGANVMVSVPALLLAILFAALLVPGSAAIAAGLAVAPGAFLRSYDRALQVLLAPSSAFARAGGYSRLALLRRDLAHELRDALLPAVARVFAAVTVTISTMSFFGFGVAPPGRDLGLMIASARGDLPDAWWAAAAPIAVLVLLVLSARLVAGLAGGERP
jgi:peptide/nickel transport system permease protein